MKFADVRQDYKKVRQGSSRFRFAQSSLGIEKVVKGAVSVSMLETACTTFYGVVCGSMQTRNFPEHLSIKFHKGPKGFQRVSWASIGIQKVPRGP